MASKGTNLALALVVVLMISNGAWAQSGCANALMSLSPCLNFVTGNTTKPSSSCCSSLTGVVQTQPKCLCTMINGGGAMAGLAVNQTLAMALPAACNVQTLPASRCSTASGPTASAASSPVGSPSSDSTPSDSSSNDTPDSTTPTTPSQTTTSPSTGSGSKTVPSTTATSSDAIANKSPVHITMLLVFIVFVGATRF